VQSSTYSTPGGNDGPTPDNNGPESDIAVFNVPEVGLSPYLFVSALIPVLLIGGSTFPFTITLAEPQIGH